MTTQPSPRTESTPDNGATRLLEYYKSKGISLQLAEQLVNAAASKPASPGALVKPDVLEAAHRVKEWFDSLGDLHVNHLAEYFLAIGRGDDHPTTLAHENTLWILNRSSEYFSDDMLKLAREFDILRQARGEPQDPSDMTTPPTSTPDELALRIVTTPDAYSAGLLALAKAYESRGERISDLEEDVERLRPTAREAFVPEVLFEYVEHEGDGYRFVVETECRGGLSVGTDDELGNIRATALTPDQSKELTTALLKWAGVGGVEWRSIDDPPSATMVGADFLLADGERVVTSIARDSAYWWTGCKKAGFTHWSPLPKPPVVK